MSLTSLATDIVFVAVFVGTFVAWLRRRDRLSRDVMAITASLASLLAIGGAETFGIDVPVWLVGIAYTLLLAQPILTLRLVDRVLGIRAWVMRMALAVWALTVVPLVATWVLNTFAGAALPPAVFTGLAAAALTVFSAVNLVAAVHMARAAKERVGSARGRLYAAAAACICVAIALPATTVASTVTPLGQAVNEVGRIIGLLAAVGFALAFVPPAWLRRMGNALTAFSFTEQLLSDRPSEPGDAIWQRLADLGQRMTGSTAALVVVGEPIIVVASEQSGITGTVELDAVPAANDGRESVMADDGGLREIAAALNAPYATVLRFELSGEPAALVLLRLRPSLFSNDDLEILHGLIGRARIFAERSAALQRQEALAQRLTATVEALEQANAAKSDFLASMSHELRTPLGAIIGFSALMLDEPVDAGRRTVPGEWVEHVKRSGEHLLALINDVLDLTKIEAGRIEITPDVFDLGAALVESVEGLRPLADRKRLTFLLNVEPGSIRADRGRLRQIVYNLLSNAIKFTPEGGQITVESRWSGNDASIVVTDTGVGIAAEDLDYIFEEFRQVGDMKEREAGTGLGLALTRRLAEAHGGSVTVTSRLGAGSRFEVSLPSSRADQYPAATPVVAAGSASAARSVRAPAQPGVSSVLVIEDDPGAVRLLRTYLEGGGYDVRFEVDGESGIGSALVDPPDAILLDILLPGIDGWEVLRRLKADAVLRRIPVMVVSVVDERSVAMNLGAVDYVLKPVDRDVLLARLAAYVSSRAEARAVRVLVIDDDPVARDLVAEALQPEGFQVTLAASGAEALDLARHAPPDVIICDLIMPEMDGFEVVARFGRSGLPADVPIIILTGHDLTERDRARLNGHVADVVRKGDDLALALRAWLDRATAASRRGMAMAGEF